MDTAITTTHKLVIAEKPSVAQSIANLLKADTFKDGYIIGNNYIVSWCIGHLVGLSSPEMYGEQYKSWSFDTLPIMPDEWRFSINPNTQKQFKVLKELMHNDQVSEIVCATDAGREGECIFRYVYNKIGCKKPVKRLWVSSLEVSAIRKGFCDLRDSREYDNLYAAGLCRAKADWLVGINGTRLFSIRYNAALNIGRVQTPTLAMIVQRDNEVRNFVKQQYFTTEIDCGTFKASTDRIDDESEARAIAEKCNGKTAAVASVKKEIKTVNPPKLYDLTTLQREANRIFGYTAQETLKFTQSLYEKKFCTYPRTDSQYITDDMENTARNLARLVCKYIRCFENISTDDLDINRKINEGATLESLRSEFENAEKELAEKENKLEKSQKDLKSFRELKEKIEVVFENKPSNSFTLDEAKKTLQRYPSINKSNYRNVDRLVAQEAENLEKIKSEAAAAKKILEEKASVFSSAEKICGGTYVQSLVAAERQRREANYIPNGVKKA